MPTMAVRAERIVCAIAMLEHRADRIQRGMLDHFIGEVGTTRVRRNPPARMASATVPSALAS